MERVWYGWDGMEKDWMVWCKYGIDGMGWDGMGWDGMDGFVWRGAVWYDLICYDMTYRF